MKRLRFILSANKGSLFRRNFIKVARANILAKLLPILFIPILTRLYSPGEFASLALFSTLLSFFISFSIWRVDWSLPNARNKSVAACLSFWGILVLFVSTLLMSLFLFLFWEYFDFWKGKEILGSLIFLMPVAIIGQGLKLLIEGWSVRKNDLTYVSYSRIVESGVNVSGSFITGILNYGSFGLIFAKVLSIWFGFATLLHTSWYFLYSLFRFLSLRRLTFTFKRFYRETTWSTLVGLINIASLSIPIILFADFYTVEEVGWYSLMLAMAAGPISIFSAALGQSFWAEAAYLARQKKFLEIRALYLKTTKRLFIFSIPIMILCILSPLYVGVILGESEWGGAGYVLAAMTPFIVGNMIFSPTIHLIVISKQEKQLIADVFRLFATISVIFLAHLLNYGFIIAVALVASVSLLSYLVIFAIHLNEYSTSLYKKDRIMTKQVKST